MTVVETKPPFADTRMAVYLRKRIDSLQGHKSQREIAAELGYPKPNVISNLKRGDIRVPVDKVLPLAKALGDDPAFLFRLWMESFYTERTADIAAVFGDIVTKNEREYIVAMRDAVGGDELPPLTAERRERLQEIVRAEKRTK